MKNKIAHLLMTTVRIAVIVLSIFCICFFILISPYKEWDTSLKIVDYDVVDVQKAALLFMSTINIAISMLSRKAHKVFVIIHVVLAAICLLRFSWLTAL